MLEPNLDLYCWGCSHTLTALCMCLGICVCVCGSGWFWPRVLPLQPVSNGVNADQPLYGFLLGWTEGELIIAHRLHDQYTSGGAIQPLRHAELQKFNHFCTGSGICILKGQFVKYAAVAYISLLLNSSSVVLNTSNSEHASTQWQWSPDQTNNLRFNDYIQFSGLNTLFITI